MDNKRFSAYCFLASLTESGRDLYNDVYVPICKRALSSYCLNTGKSGLYTDLQTTIIEMYGIKVPESIISLLLKRIQKSLSKKEQKNISLQLSEKASKSPKSFKINSFDFTDYEDNYKESQRNVNLIEKEFSEYAEKNKELGCTSFTSFIEKYQKKLNGFFSGNGLINNDDLSISYLCHANFLVYINQNRNDLYKVAEQLYIGSIVASYFENEINLEAKFRSGEVYFLDTQIILQALNLQGEYETNSALEILEIIKNTGGIIKILNITFDEVSHQLEKAISKWDNKNPQTIINDACLHNKKGKDWLILLQAQLATRIEKELELSIEPIPLTLKEKFRQSNDIKGLLEHRNKQNAEHDVFAYLYVRYLRDKHISLIQKAKYWFVSNNSHLYKYNKEHSGYSKIGEVILPDYLLGLLWLKDPKKHIDKVKKTGLSSLLSLTLKEEIPSRDLIFNYEEKLKTTGSFSDEEYILLHNAVSNESAKKLEKYLLEDDVPKIQTRAQALIKQEKEKQLKQHNMFTEMDKQLKDLKESFLKSKMETATLVNSNEMSYTEKEKELEGFKRALDLEKKKRKITLYISIIVIIIFCLLWALFYSPFSNQIKIILSMLTGLLILILNIIAAKSGLWSFINMALNLYNKMSKK